MDDKTILSYLKDHYRKEDEAELLMENKIDDDILEASKSKKKLRVNNKPEK